MMSKKLALLALAGAANAASLSDIKHVVMLMMENRAYNHYFGTMSGTRGFADPNVLVNDDGVSVWYQNVTGLTTEAEYLLPYYLNYLGGEEDYNKSQCLCAGDNNWIPTHQAMNNGRMDMWAQIDYPQSWGYFKREDIPFHFALAEAYTIGDEYFCSIASNTDSNRLFWQSGTINVPGGPQALGSGGVLLDDVSTNGCSGVDLDCLPYYWPAYAQYMDEAGVDWKAFQDTYDNAGTNQLVHFYAFQNASTDSTLYQRGMLYDGVNGLEGFKARAANGTLPTVSWIFAPNILQEHSPYTPNDGAWFINQVIGSVINGTGYNETVVLLNYDEGGGWGDSVPPPVSPNGTAGEWFEDPYGELGYTYSGPGPRVPLTIVSPFTRGGHVFTEPADHGSILQFLEQVLTAQGYEGVTTTQMDSWRRETFSDLVNAFDFENPDYSIPVLPQPAYPMTNSEGEIIGMYAGFCEVEWPVTCSTGDYISGIPYGNQTEEDSLWYEDGYKGVRGQLTEGRYLVFETDGYALSRTEGLIEVPDVSKATSDHDSITQRWVLHATTELGNTFTLSSAVDGKYISDYLLMTSDASDAAVFTIEYTGSSQYTIKGSDGLYLAVDLGILLPSLIPAYFNIYAVTYH